MTPIKHIVISGGGPLLLNMYGALKQSNIMGAWNKENICSLFGTSAGAILCVLISLDYSWDELDNYIINRPWQHVIKFNVLEAYDYYCNNGIMDIKFIYDMFGPLFKAKDIDLNINYAEFEKITGKSLHIYATKFETFETTEFSTETTPHISVLETVYASSTLPILFKPRKIENLTYIDGCIYLDYPLAKCLEKPNIDSKSVLGIKKKQRNAETTDATIMNMFDYLIFIMNMVFTKTQIYPLYNKSDIHEIEISSTFEDLANFFKMANSAEDRKHAIQRGMDDCI